MITKGDDNAKRILKAVAVTNMEVQHSVPTSALPSASSFKT